MLSYGFGARFAGAHPYALLQVEDEYFSVADMVGLRAFYYGLDCDVEELVVDSDFQADFFKQVHFHFVAAIVFAVSSLSSATEGVGN